MISLTCEIENMAQRNLMMKQKPSHRHREQAGGYQVGGGEGGKDWEAGMSRRKLLYIEQHAEQKNKVLLDHRNYSQYPVIKL